MKTPFLLLAALLLSSSVSFSQTATATTSGDSLVCFPVKYLELIRRDLERGDEDTKRVGELNQNIKLKNDEIVKIRKDLGLTNMMNMDLQDSLEGKNSVIMHLHTKARREKKMKFFYISLIGILTTLYTLK